jgi:hypothetical protein
MMLMTLDAVPIKRSIEYCFFVYDCIKYLKWYCFDVNYEKLFVSHRAGSGRIVSHLPQS